MFILLGVSSLLGAVTLYFSGLERVQQEPFRYKRLLRGLNIALLLVVMAWAIERMVFAAKYTSPTLADYFVMLIAGIVGLVATIVSYRWYKRTVKRSEDLERSSQAETSTS